jgi:hypothetical protein
MKVGLTRYIPIVLHMCIIVVLRKLSQNNEELDE